MKKKLNLIRLKIVKNLIIEIKDLIKEEKIKKNESDIVINIDTNSSDKQAKIEDLNNTINTMEEDTKKVCRDMFNAYNNLEFFKINDNDVNYETKSTINEKYEEIQNITYTKVSPESYLTSLKKGDIIIKTNPQYGDTVFEYIKNNQYENYINAENNFEEKEKEIEAKFKTIREMN